MKSVISILLLGLLGFSGCSSSGAEDTSAFNVRAVGWVYENSMFASALVIDQEENLSYDAMLTINNEPMNIGFYDAEVQTTGDYYPYYFLDYIEVYEGDDVMFIAKARLGHTLYSNSAVVPDRINIVEPQPEAQINPGDDINVKWEGGAPSTFFQVFYFVGESSELNEANVLQGSKQAVIETSLSQSGNIFITVIGGRYDDETDDTPLDNTSGCNIFPAASVSAIITSGSDSKEGYAGGGEATSKCDNAAQSWFNECMRSCGNGRGGGRCYMLCRSKTFNRHWHCRQ